MTLPLNKVLDIINKHSNLEKELSSTNLDSKTFASKSKEYSDLSEIIKFASEYYNFEKHKKDLEKITLDPKNDNDMKELAKIELQDLQKNTEKTK